MKSRRFYNYIIFENGDVLSLLSGKYITKRIGTRGYSMINLCINGKCKTFAFHRIMAELFIPNPNNLPQINHKDGNKLNNSLDNLEWITASGNNMHALKTGLRHAAKGKNTNNGRFNEDEIRNIRTLYKEGYSQRKIASKFNVTKGAIAQIIRKETYAWVS